LLVMHGRAPGHRPQLTPAAAGRVEPAIDLEIIFAKSRLPLYPYGGILVVA